MDEWVFVRVQQARLGHGGTVGREGLKDGPQIMEGSIVSWEWQIEGLRKREMLPSWPWKSTGFPQTGIAPISADSTYRRCTALWPPHPAASRCGLNDIEVHYPANKEAHKLSTCLEKLNETDPWKDTLISLWWPTDPWEKNPESLEGPIMGPWFWSIICITYFLKCGQPPPIDQPVVYPVAS